MEQLPYAPLSYIGPGPGIALAQSFLVVLTAAALAALAVLAWPIRWVSRAVRGRRALERAKVRRVVVIGLDGLEPSLVEKRLEDGGLPHLAAMRRQGAYARLGTTYPPITPVAWSSFSTGANPGKHNIFDFIVRRRADYRPEMSSVRIQPPVRKLRVAGYDIPLSRPRIVGRRKSRPFWDVMGRQGVFSAVIRVPMTFPPDRFRGVQLSAMCAPDLLGSQGTYFLHRESPRADRRPDGDSGEEAGVEIRAVRRNGRIFSELIGPANPLRSDRRPMRVPLEIVPEGDGAAQLRLCGQRLTLKRNEWSDWVSVRFRATWGVQVRGVCRMLLKQLDEPFEMYCSPIQIDPAKPLMPISHPLAYSAYLGSLLGPFATMGLAEDTDGLSDGALDEEQFLTHLYDIHDERKRMLMDALDRVHSGLIVCVFDGPDRLQHMFWRFIDEGHPALLGRPKTHSNAIDEMYEKMDQLVGEVARRAGPDAAVIVMSDHGFKTFRRCVDLNAWLRMNGYLTLKDGATCSERPYLADVDWTRTKAYAIGLTGVYINEKGRESRGIVEPGGPKRAVTDELRRKLEELYDDERNQPAIFAAAACESVYDGPYVDNAPDIIVGYREGYRVSWGTAVGKCDDRVLFDNRRAWSGDHCVHPSLAPGVLFSNLRLKTEKAHITDLAPTLLELLGVPVPSYMDGKSLLCAAETSSN